MSKSALYKSTVGVFIATVSIAGLLGGPVKAIGGVKIPHPSRGYCNNFDIAGVATNAMACFSLTDTAQLGKEDLQTALYMTNTSTVKVNLTTRLAVNGVPQNGSTTNSYDPSIDMHTSWTTSVSANAFVDTVSMIVEYNGQVVDVVSGK